MAVATLRALGRACDFQTRSASCGVIGADGLGIVPFEPLQMREPRVVSKLGRAGDSDIVLPILAGSKGRYPILLARRELVHTRLGLRAIFSAVESQSLAWGRFR
jgi:hypothetical protein